MINVNADAMLSEDAWVGLGVVARDHKGSVLFAAVRRTLAWWPLKWRRGKSFTWQLGLQKHMVCGIVLESDSQVFTSRLLKAALLFSDLDAILGDTISLCSSFDSIIFFAC